ncbi:MAG: ABC transporter permease [Ktedonobacteraceae bacterium]
MTIPVNIREEPQVREAQQSKQAMTGVVRIVNAFRQDARLWFGVVLLLIILAALFAPVISPYSPLLYHPSIATQGPSFAHPFGTDVLGRDQLSRVIYGARISLSVGVASIILGGMLGTFMGILAAYTKGWVDQGITMIVDALLSFPSLILALAIAAALGPNSINVAIALAIVRVPIYARIARGQTLQESSQQYLEAARVSGTRTWKILLRHILPNIFSPLLVQATISISFAILDESVLSFLGLGAQPPTPEWGSMISDAQGYLSSDPWMIVGPALAIIIVVLSLNLFGDAIRDRLDPRSATRFISPTKE